MGGVARAIQGGIKKVTYYDRLRNRHDRNLYESPEEKEERFRRLMENQETSEQKELYTYDYYKEQEFRRLLEKLKISKEEGV